MRHVTHSQTISFSSLLHEWKLWFISVRFDKHFQQTPMTFICLGYGRVVNQCSTTVSTLHFFYELYFQFCIKRGREIWTSKNYLIKSETPYLNRSPKFVSTYRKAFSIQLFFIGVDEIMFAAITFLLKTYLERWDLILMLDTFPHSYLERGYHASRPTLGTHLVLS